MNLEKKIQELRNELAQRNDLSIEFTYYSIQNWFNKISTLFDKSQNLKPDEIERLNELKYYLNLNFHEHNFDNDWNSIKLDLALFSENKKQLSALNSMVLIRDILHKFLIFEINTTCPKCLNSSLRCYSSSKDLYYECDNCTSLFDSNLNHLIITPKLIPAPKSLLIEKGILK
ncbi:MAG: hypothetical protein ACK5Z2_12480 [Bacteroidota bacterium]